MVVSMQVVHDIYAYFALVLTVFLVYGSNSLCDMLLRLLIQLHCWKPSSQAIETYDIEGNPM
jgi:hypothetical protein